MSDQQMEIQTNDIIPAGQEKMIAEIQDYLISGNRKGNERRIISIGQSLVSYELSVQKSYINMLCESEYPISAAMTINSMHHKDADVLKEIVLESIETLNWSLFDKIISFIYINADDKLVALFDSIEDEQVLASGIEESVYFLACQSEYKFLFDLLYDAARCRHNSILRNCLRNIEINEFYVKQCRDAIQRCALAFYDKEDYDSLFFLCKNLKILQHLKMILHKDTEELENRFLEAQTINGVRLAFRVVQQEFKDDEKAYSFIISKISKMNESEDIQYIYFCYLLKLVELQNKISDGVKEQLSDIGEVKLLKEKNYGINLLAECLENVLINQGMETYNELVKILDVNHIFNYEKSIPRVNPYYIYKNESLDNIHKRKEYFRKLKDEEKWDDKSLFRFYMNSFYKYLLSIHDLFEAIYVGNEDRVYIKNICNEYVFYGKVKSINTEKENVTAFFENSAYKNFILLTQKHYGENHLNLLQRGDEFSFKLNKFNPRSGYIGITSFKLLNDSRQKQFDDLDLSYWENFRGCLREIVSKQTFSALEKEKLEEVPHIQFKKLQLINEYTALFSEVLFSLKCKVGEIIDFIKALEKHKNNLFDINSKDQFISFARTEELLNKSEETVKSIIDQKTNEKDLIWIYVNSYLRLTAAVQGILESIIEPESETLQLESLFYEYRFYGFLSSMFINNGTKSGYARTGSIRSIRSMSFLLDKECGITEEMIENKNYVSFRLRKYFRVSNRVVIEDVRNHGQNKMTKLQNWSVIHNCNKLIRYQGRVLKETIEELSELPKLNFIKVEEMRLLNDFIWCMNNLSKNEDDLFLYINALGINNPYYYIPGQYNNNYMRNPEISDVDKGRIILSQLIERNYNISKILLIYLNSYLCGLIPIDNVFEQYYESRENQKSRKVYYMPGKILEIMFSATIACIRDNILVLNLNQIFCRCRVCVRIDETDYTESDFTENQEVKVRLCEYNLEEYTIYAEIYD